jgi:hypothetical protein
MSLITIPKTIAGISACMITTYALFFTDELVSHMEGYYHPKRCIYLLIIYSMTHQISHHSPSWNIYDISPEYKV